MSALAEIKVLDLSRLLPGIGFTVYDALRCKRALEELVKE